MGSGPVLALWFPGGVRTASPHPSGTRMHYVIVNNKDRFSRGESKLLLGNHTVQNSHSCGRMGGAFIHVLHDFSLTVKAATLKYSYLGVIRLFHLLIPLFHTGPESHKLTRIDKYLDSWLNRTQFVKIFTDSPSP